MDLSFSPIDYTDRTSQTLLLEWYNDRELSPLFNLFQSAEQAEYLFTRADLARRADREEAHPGWGDRWIRVNGQRVGEARFEMDTAKLLTRKPGTGWLSLVIGEETARGQGIGGEVVQHLEACLAERGAQRVEVGVFEYNEASLRLFHRLGYQEIARREQRVWWRGQMWAEVRLLREEITPAA